MKKTLTLTLLVLSLSNTLFGQTNVVPEEIQSILHKKLEEGQAVLKEQGYEICASSLVGKRQDWFNEKTQHCVTIKFDKKTKEILEITTNAATSECQQGLDASRKVWEKYHDGQAPYHADKLDSERDKLKAQGYNVSYWIDEIVPGKISEYWVNNQEKKAKLIVWEKSTSKWEMTNDSDYKYGVNPAPKNEN